LLALEFTAAPDPKLQAIDLPIENRRSVSEDDAIEAA
jgi:hypothetical protein